MTQLTPLRTKAAIIKALGGKRKTAVLCKVGVTAICNWMTDNYISPAWHYRLHLAAEMRGYRIDPRALDVDVKALAVEHRKVA